MGRLDNKVAIITGGNSGIGRATAALFCREGAKVIISARRAENNKVVVDEISAAGGDISSVSADVTKPEDCKRVVAAAIETYGRIDILVNNAGIADKHMSVTNCTEEWYDTVCMADQYSVFYMCKYALPHFEENGAGAIVNISSIGSYGVAGVAYSAAKSAVNAMTRNIAIQYAATDIRVNAVAPGPTPTPLNSPEAVATFDKDMAALTAKHIDLDVPESTADDQAEAILFFASDAARAITGQILYVDHGSALY
jgi:NAD(P)-dependent dehydrogenase (short-subunit alcohol dehydrogenase family)